MRRKLRAKEWKVHFKGLKELRCLLFVHVNVNACMGVRKDTFQKECKEAQVFVDGTLLNKQIATAKIAESAKLSVQPAAANDSNIQQFFLRYYPRADLQQWPMSQDMHVDKDGSFQLELVNNRTNESCNLLSELVLSCGEGFELGKKNKCTAVNDNSLSV